MALLDWDILPNFILFAFVLSVTPGPNNIITFFYTLRYGVLRAVLFRLGVTIGFPIMTIAVLLGLSPVFDRYPMTIYILNYIGAGFLLYIAYQIIRSDPDLSSNDEDSYVLGFWGGAFFQLVNGKAWAMALTTVSLYANPEQTALMQSGTIFMAFTVAAPFATLPWIIGALSFRSWLSNPKILKNVNRVLGSMLAVIAVLGVI